MSFTLYTKLFLLKFDLKKEKEAIFLQIAKVVFLN